jgi:hypothetical protein
VKYITSREREDAISFVKDSYPGHFLGIKIVANTEAEIKCVMHLL